MIKDELAELITTSPFVDVHNNTMSWISTFGIRSYLTSPTVAIPVIPMDKRDSRMLRLSEAIESLVKSRRHKTVKDTIVKDMVQKRDLGLVLSKLPGLDTFYGISLLSVCEKIEFIYQNMITNSFQIFERIVVTDKDMLGSILDVKLCRAQKGLLLPNDGILFNRNFFKQLKDVVRGKYEVHNRV